MERHAGILQEYPRLALKPVNLVGNVAGNLFDFPAIMFAGLTMRRRLAVVANLCSRVRTGGAIRALKSIREYARRFSVTVLAPPMRPLDAGCAAGLISAYGVEKVLKAENSLGALYRSEPVYALIPHELTIEFLRIPAGVGFEGVVVLHENAPELVLGAALAEEYSAPSVALLMNPPFYSDRRRAEKINAAYRLWYEALRPHVKGVFKGLLLDAYSKSFRKPNLERLLKRYSLVVGLTKATLVEMGPGWLERAYPLDPGVGLDDDDLGLIREVRAQRSVRDYVMFGGMVAAPHKGFVEALLAFKSLAARHSRLKLVATGEVPSSIAPGLWSFIKRLGLEDRVVLAGYVDRTERLRLVGGARLMLYPSHIDAFSFSVLESLLLGTPVVAYRIPALELYFKGYEGVVLVEEGDFEALAAEAESLIRRETRCHSAPNVRTWESIAAEELSLIERVLSERGG